MTQQEQQMAYMLLLYLCTRYCMETTRGGDKGEIHWRISAILASIANNDRKKGAFIARGCDEDVKGMCEVHKYLTDGITDRMDEVIGLPLSEKDVFIDYDIYGERFINWIFDHWNDIMEIGRM